MAVSYESFNEDGEGGRGLEDLVRGLFDGTGYHQAVTLAGFLALIVLAYYSLRRFGGAIESRSYGAAPKWAVMAAFCALLCYGYFAGDPVAGWK